MTPFIKDAIEAIYRLLTILAKSRIISRFIFSDKYEYDYNVLNPLAMTSVPERKILFLSQPIPIFPKDDELPNAKWVSLVLTQLSILGKKNKSNNLINEFVYNGNEIDSLESIKEEIKAANGQEDLTKSVVKLKSALGLKPSLINENNIRLESNISKVRDRFDAIDREVEEWLGQFSSAESANLTADEFEKPDEELYQHLQEIAKFLGNELIDQEAVVEEQLEGITTLPTLLDYENLTDPLSIKPATLSNFQQNQVFAYMQVAGPNPLMLQQIEKIDSRLPITNEQYQNIVRLEDSLNAALQEGRLYLADYSKLGTLKNGSFDGGEPKYIYAPVALFAVPPDKYSDRNLLPIAIRCQQTPGDENPIFTPLDGDNWMTAKTVLQMADSNYHELISHLAQTHLLIEPFVLATNRCFTDPNHQVRLLLKPHLEGTILINYGAHKYLLRKAGPIDSLLSGTIESNSQLAIKEARNHLANFKNLAFPRSLKERGVNNSKQLPIYPYRDDGQRIWDAIYQWVDEYLRLFYRNDKSVETDQELQNWAGELRSKGHCHIGEEGDGRIKTLDDLVEAISTVIFTASAQHAAVNFPQSGLMTYAPAFPLGCYSPAPTKLQQQQDFIELLPDLKQAELQIQTLYLLGSVYYTQLGDYSGSSFQDKKVKVALDKFKIKLAEIEQAIIKEDSQRLVSYRYLLPSKIPQSINI
jgi:arachidonate 15-lipoxygenase